MKQIMAPLGALMVVAAMLGAAGCESSSKERDSKREYDRTMMRLQDADRERTELKSQVDKLRENLEVAENKSRDAQKDLTTTQSRMQAMQEELTKSRSTAASAADLQRSLTDLQAHNEKLSADVKSLQQQLSAARNATNMTPASSQPAMNK